MLYSSDGRSWERAADRAAESLFLDDIAWDGDRFIAVGSDGTNGAIIHSTDGQRWDRVIDAGTADGLHGVAWVGTRFVAVGHNGTIVVSPPGLEMAQEPHSRSASSEPEPQSAPQEGTDDVRRTHTASVLTQETDVCSAGSARSDWTLVRTGGGFVSPAGTAGRTLSDVAWGGGASWR